MMEILVQETLVPVLLAVLTAAATWLATTARAWVKRKAEETENALLSQALSLAGQSAATAVAELTQTAVANLKAAREDGRLTADEAQAAFTAAVERTWSMIGQSARQTLVGEAGSEAAAKNDMIGPVVEQMVGATRSLSKPPPASQEQAVKEVTLARARLGLQ